MTDGAIFAGVILAFILLGLVRTAWFRGMVGEWRVNSMLKSRLNSRDYRLIEDVTLPTLDGGTTQVDHIVISRYGVFVIETKNMSGWIFGGERQARWTQVIFNWRSQFQNPLRQNYRHVKTIQDLLGLQTYQLHNLVVFVGSSEPRTEMPYNVVWGSRSLIDVIKSEHRIVFEDRELDKLANRLQGTRLKPGGKTRRQHVRHLKNRGSGAQHAVVRCPRCGANMVERVNRKSGELFLGCSKYPRCKGTRSSS